MRTQRASKAEALRLRVIVGRAMRTMLPSNWDMKAPIVVLVRTVYLYCILVAPDYFRPVRSLVLVDLPLAAGFARFVWRQLGCSLGSNVIVFLRHFLEDYDRLIPRRLGDALHRISNGTGQLILLL